MEDGLRDAADEVRRVWDGNAQFWDDRMADGNDFHLGIVRPAVERLLAVGAGQRVLDVGCGNGLFARRLATLGARVLAFDVSPAMIDRARARGDGEGRVDYRVVDATDDAALSGLVGEPFDAAVANMVLMDIPSVGPLARALARLLRPDGRFVFAVSHPCFHTTGTSLVMREEDDGGRPVVSHAVEVRRYRRLAPTKGVAIVGQPESQTYFDRTLADLLAPFFAAGLVLDGLEEPVVPERAGDGCPSLWDAHREVPPVLAVRLRNRPR